MWYRVAGEYGPCGGDYYDRLIYTSRGPDAAREIFKRYALKAYGSFTLSRMSIYVRDAR